MSSSKDPDHSACQAPDQISDQLVRLLMRTTRDLSNEIHTTFNRNIMRPKAFYLLHFLHHQHRRGEECVRQADIAADLKLAAPTVTQMLNQLEEDGQVERVRDTQDRRVVWVRLTEQGEEILDRVFCQVKMKVKQAVHCLGLEETQQLLSLLQRANLCLQEMNADAESEDAHA